MTIEAMKLALEALESSRIFVTSREKIKHPEGTELYDAAITALRAAIEETEKQEPVVYMYPVDFEGIQKTQTHAEVMTKKFANLEICIPLYTAPRQWQGLTDEDLDIRALWDVLANMKNADGSIVVQFAKAIEAKLKERNK